MSNYDPPFHISEKMMNLVSEISEQIGRINVLSHGTLNPHLTAILDGKRVLGDPNEIREVTNAFEAYES